MSNKLLTKNFKESEFKCKCKCGEVIVIPRVFNTLQALRDKINRPIVVTSGYRCVKHNDEVGGSIGSAHLFGLAADFYCPELSTSVLWEYLERLKVNGLGSYPETNPQTLHIDFKLRFSRWVRRDGKYIYLFSH